MPRNMSCFYTVEQVRNRTKTVTRRLGWKDLKPGELFWMVEKAQGLKKGEKIKRVELCQCLSNYPERLNRITKADVVREGFPDMSPAEFIKRFCNHMKCKPRTVVNRIAYQYAEGEQ